MIGKLKKLDGLLRYKVKIREGMLCRYAMEENALRMCWCD